MKPQQPLPNLVGLSWQKNTNKQDRIQTGGNDFANELLAYRAESLLDLLFDRAKFKPLPDQRKGPDTAEKLRKSCE